MQLTEMMSQNVNERTVVMCNSLYSLWRSKPSSAFLTLRRKRADGPSMENATAKVYSATSEGSKCWCRGFTRSRGSRTLSRVLAWFLDTNDRLLTSLRVDS